MKRTRKTKANNGSLRQEAMVTTAERSGTYLEAYSELRAQAGEREPVWLRQSREDAWTRFSAKGFPTTHDEDWRFTNLAALAKTPFVRAPKAVAPLLKSQIEACLLPGAACQLVFVNGHFAPELSAIEKLPEGLEVHALAQALGAKGAAPEGRHAPEGIEQHLGRYADVRRDVFAALNTALWEDGAYIHVRRGPSDHDASSHAHRRGGPQPRFGGRGLRLHRR
jgi:Fe-S cluster assembly protein SufD